MDYEEKYKNALKKAEAYHNDYTKDIIEDIFPELKESSYEDEKIRKELLDYCKNRAEKYPNDPKYKNISAWITWLEKQCQVKESQIPQHDNKTCKENDDSLTS